MISKAVLIKLFIAGGIVTGLATGSYFLANGLEKNRRIKRDLEDTAGSGSNLGKDEDNTEWEMIFKATSGEVICQRKEENKEKADNPQSQKCDSEWMKKSEEKVKERDEFRLKIKKNLSGGVVKNSEEAVKKELEEKLENLKIGHKSEVKDRKECKLENQENGYDNYYVFICK